MMVKLLILKQVVLLNQVTTKITEGTFRLTLALGKFRLTFVFENLIFDLLVCLIFE